MVWGTYIVEWLHILSGILWFGSGLYINMVLAPSMRTLPPARSGYAFEAIAHRTERVLLPTGYATVVLGILRGTVFGRIDNADVLFGSRYGIVWLISLGLGIFLALFGQFVMSSRVKGMAAFIIKAGESNAPPPPPGAPPPPPAKALMQASMLDLAAFLAIFTCMVILNFS